MARKSGLTETAQLLRIVTAVVLVAALYFGRAVFIPLALALLLSLLLAPVMAFFAKIRVPRVLAIIMIAVVLCGLALGLAWKSSLEITDLANQMPVYRKTLDQKIQTIGGFRNSHFNKVSTTLGDLEKELIKTAPAAADQDHAKLTPAPGSSSNHPLAVQVVPPSSTKASVETVLGSMGSAGLVVIFTIFILMGREDLRNRFVHLASGGRLNLMTQALDEATTRIQKYLFLQSIVNGFYGLIIGVGLHFIGIPDAWLWGLFSAILRFLPYIGAPASAAIPILLSLAVFPGWGHAWVTMGFFFVLEVAVANFVEPLLYGAQVGLSTLAILVAAVFWTLIWGFPGLILATPLTVSLAVMGRYIPSLSFLKVILGDQPEISGSNLYYQRLLASDQNEARQVLEQHLKDKTLDELYSEVLIPALSLVEQDRHRNELDETTLSFIMQSTRELIEELGDSVIASADGAAIVANEPHNFRIICIPARDEADELVGLVLAQLLERSGFLTDSIPITATSEVLSIVAEQNPDLVCISALPPFAIEHARTLYQKIHAKFPKLTILICFWHFEGDLEKIERRLKLTQTHRVMVNLADVVEHVKGGVKEETVQVVEVEIQSK